MYGRRSIGKIENDTTILHTSMQGTRHNFGFVHIIILISWIISEITIWNKYLPWSLILLYGTNTYHDY